MTTTIKKLEKEFARMYGCASSYVELVDREIIVRSCGDLKHLCTIDEDFHMHSHAKLEEINLNDCALIVKMCKRIMENYKI